MTKELRNNELVLESIRTSESKKELIDVLVEYTHEITERINNKHKGVLSLHFRDRTRDSTDLSGWVLDIGQRYIKEEWGFPEDDDDPYFSLVSRVEITELEINDGNPKTTIHECIDNQGNIISTGPFGISVNFTPMDFVNYLRNVEEFGNARLKLSDIVDNNQ